MLAGLSGTKAVGHAGSEITHIHPATRVESRPPGVGLADVDPDLSVIVRLGDCRWMFIGLRHGRLRLCARLARVDRGALE